MKGQKNSYECLLYKFIFRLLFIDANIIGILIVKYNNANKTICINQQCYRLRNWIVANQIGMTIKCK